MTKTPRFFRDGTHSGIARHIPVLASCALFLRLVACGNDGAATAGGGGATAGGGNAGMSSVNGGAAGTGANGGSVNGGASGVGGGAGSAGAAAGVGGGGAAGVGGGGAGGSGVAGASAGGPMSAGGGGNAGACSVMVPSPTCTPSTGKVTYYSADGCNPPVAHDYTCPSGCVFVGGNSVRCDTDATFETCITKADCGVGSTCAGSDVKLFSMPECVAGLCQWSVVTSETCTISCSGGQCLPPSSGATSGSFPTGQPATCTGDMIMFAHQQGGGGGSGPSVQTHACAKACYTDTNGTGCVPTPGEVPFHTCETPTDVCPKAPTMCDPTDPTTVTTFLNPVCGGFGACVWTAKTVTACPAGTTCTTNECL